MAGRRNKKRLNICSEVIDSITDANSGCLGRDEVVFGGLGWFVANMASQRNKNAFKFLLQLLILSQKHILGV